MPIMDIVGPLSCSRTGPAAALGTVSPIVAIPDIVATVSIYGLSTEDSLTSLEHRASET